MNENQSPETHEVSNVEAFLQSKAIEKELKLADIAAFNERSRVISHGINYALIGVLVLSFTILLSVCLL